VADQKVSAMTALAALASGDVFYCIDDPLGTPLSRRCTIDVIITYLYATLSMSSITVGTLPVARGGTGSTTVAGTRTTLGLGIADSVAFTTLSLDDELDMLIVTDNGPASEDVAGTIFGGMAMRTTAETVFTRGWLFRSPGGYRFADVPANVETQRFVIAMDGKANFGMANHATKTPLSQLEVTGNLLVGLEASTGVLVAPTNGIYCDGDIVSGVDPASALADYHFKGGADSRVMIEGTGATSAGFQIRTNAVTRWDIHTASGSVDLRFNNGTDVVTFNAVGSLALGGTSFPSGGGTPVLVLSQSSGNPTGMPSNTAGLVAKDAAGTCELYAWDEAGNVSIISPHASLSEAEEAGITFNKYDLAPSVYHSQNIYTGIHVYRYTDHNGHTQVKQVQRAPEMSWDENQARQRAANDAEMAQWLDDVDRFRQEVREWQAAPFWKREVRRPVFNIPRPKEFVPKPRPRLR